MKIISVNPFNLQVNAELEQFSDASIESVLSNAGNAFMQWKLTSFSERKKLFIACSETLLRRKDALARLITIEMGKPVKEAKAEIEKCASVCNYYAENGEVFLQHEEVKTESYKSFVCFEPLGCILAVMPWNFPFWQVFRFAAPSLMAGNVGLLKHASNVPLCSLEIEKVFLESGFPQGVFQSVLIGSAAIPKIISNNVVKAVTLTGSEKAGAEVAAEAARHIKKAVLELGGSDPFIVLEDADLERAVTNAVKGRMVNNGQSCIAAKRFIVHEKVYDQFVTMMKEKFELLKLGDPSEEETEIGPMARKDLMEELLGKVEASVQMGAKVITGARRSAVGPCFIEPTILTDVKAGMPAFAEEMFGPVATVFKVSGDDEAIQIANNTTFGLGASLWTADLYKAELLAARIESGNVFINAIVASDPRLPFGGVKASGFGRELGSYGIKEFVNIKSVKISL